MIHKIRALPLLFLCALLSGAWALVPNDVSACGGFFCNNSSPVNQAAERIIFARNEDGTTTAIIQIQYSGPSESFAWMLPVEGSPEIAVSSNQVFTALQQATNPSYTRTVTVEGECANDFFNSPSAAAGSDGGFGSDVPSSDAGMTVTVVDSGSVGPYDYVIISVDTEADDIAAAATDWLNDNDYDVSPMGRDRLVPYLEGGMNLLAFRLTKGNDAGSIRPVVINFGRGLASIPIRPTAAAATPDMGVMVWVLGEHRAIPANYMDLRINEARLNWFSPNAGYGALVTAAANEAGGQGFVTEFSGDAPQFSNTIFAARARWETYNVTSSESDLDAIYAVSEILGQYEGMTEVILAEVPKPADVGEEEWQGCVSCYLETFRGAATIEGFDRAAFLARADREVAEPMRRVADLFEANRKVTRFYTTMSPEEMTLDPAFDFNPDLGDYSRNHVAEQVIECHRGVSRFDARWRMTLPDGTVVRGESTNWPDGLASSPALGQSRRVGTAGLGEIMTDNSEIIAAGISENNAHYRRLVRGGGCSTSPANGGALPLPAALFALGLFWMRRRS